MTADKTSKKWKYLYAAVWRKSVQGNVLNKLGQLCAWKEKRNFSAKPSANKTPVSCLWNTRFSTFEVALPRDLRKKFIPEI